MSVLPLITDLDEMRRPVRFVPIARDTLRRSPLAPPCNFKRQFLLGFNNYLRSALTLREVSSGRDVWRTGTRRAAFLACQTSNPLVG
jgi:hypothetical protein